MTYNNAENYCVRIKCNGKIGSGVLIAGCDTFYVFTAAHCLGDEMPIIKEIEIQKQTDYQSEFKNISVVSIKEFDSEKDYALLEIDFEDEEKLLYQYKIAHSFLPNTTVEFCGYQGINNDEYRPFPCKLITSSDSNHCFKITLYDGETFQQAGNDGDLIAGGLSGSGVFVYRHKTPFLIGILNSVVTEQAYNSDINCCSVHHIKDYFEDYIDLSDFENLINWEENNRRERTESEILAFKKTDSQFFNYLYKKNKVLYPDSILCDEITVNQIRSYLSMKENIDTYSRIYPDLFSEFKTKVSKLVNQVKTQYSLSVDRPNEAKLSQRDLQNELKSILEFMPSTTTFDLSEFQLIEWLGICTLNFTNND
ncbi:trypsin-like serine protease [Formosa haliotis]|uniref:trypsin-like serine protease n=1 Tax=Formosa haliotis TaxID=1555194 RepID=UPI0008242CE6|nr:trypsin-like serine protease [Formosa haliotis]